MEVTDGNHDETSALPHTLNNTMDMTQQDLEWGISTNEPPGPRPFVSETCVHSSSPSSTVTTPNKGNSYNGNKNNEIVDGSNITQNQIAFNSSSPNLDNRNKRLFTCTPPHPIQNVTTNLADSKNRKPRLQSDRSGDSSFSKRESFNIDDDDDDGNDVQPFSQSLPTYLATNSFFGLRPHSEIIASSALKLERPVVENSRTRGFMSPPTTPCANPTCGTVTMQSSRRNKQNRFVETIPEFSTESDDDNNITSNIRTHDERLSLRTTLTLRPVGSGGDKTGNVPSKMVQHVHTTSNDKDDESPGTNHHTENNSRCAMTVSQEKDEENFSLDLENLGSSSSSPCSVISKEDSLQLQTCDIEIDENCFEEDQSEFKTPRETPFQVTERDRFFSCWEGEKVESNMNAMTTQTKQNTSEETVIMGDQGPRHSGRRQLIKRKSEVLFSLEASGVRDNQMDVKSRDVRVGGGVDADSDGLVAGGDDRGDDNGDDEKDNDNLVGDNIPFSRPFYKEEIKDVPCTPTTPKTRKIESVDPYHIFQVQNAPCLIFRVRVLRGRNITLGLRDYYDTPDPYVFLHVPTSPEGRKYTTIKTDNPNPVWNEEFTFFINFTQTNILEIRLMESNALWFDQEVGTLFFDVCNIQEIDVAQRETFVFNGVSEVDMEFHLEFDKNPTLRYSLCLSGAEKTFQEARKRRVMEGVRRLLGEEDGPRNINEVPTIAVIGSGGGFRAMTAYSGVFKALVETGVLDCVSYAGGLSGSSWLLSTLYSHPKWPNLDMSEFLDEMMNNVDKNLRRFFNPSTMYQYASYMIKKRREGQPVSFTDIFGRMVGETLLPERMDSTLSDQREKIQDGKSPMPLYTCVHVKKDVPAKSFQEWVEFSPYEIGMPKYGTFMDSSLFGSKFFMGKLVKQYQEQPLHFLQGIWGSAFCILFKRLLDDNRRIDPAEMIRQEMGKQLEDLQNESSSDCSDDDDEDDDSNNSSLESNESNNEVSKNSVESVSDESMDSQCAVSEGDSAYSGELNRDDADGDGDDEDDEDIVPLPFSNMRKGSLEKMQINKEGDSDESKTLRGIVRMTSSEVQDLNQSDGLKKSVNWGHCPARKSSELRKKYARSSSSMRKSRSGSKGYWKNFMKSVFESDNSLLSVINTRQGRAAVIHNFMRGLSLQQTYPLSPFTPVQDRVQQGDEFDGIFEMHPTSVKNIYMVDAGLTFNSPYPLVLRPQREVDIILSFDFSARPSDNHQPFKELLLAEKWARLNRLPFPPIDLTEFERDGMKELFVFRHPTDPHCPVVLHFVLANKTFRYYSRPGVPRQTKEEFDFAEFDIFDDPEAPYSTFNFTYTHKSFQRLTKLTEFNTLLHLDDIKKVIRDSVLSKRKNPNRYNMDTKDTFLLSMKNVLEMKKKLHKFIRRLGSTRGSVSSPFSTPTPEMQPSEDHFFSGYNRELSVGSSADGSVFGTPRENLQGAPNFSGHVDSPDGKIKKRPPALSPFSSNKNGGSNENRHPKTSSPALTPTSPSSSLPYRTPPSSAIPFGTPPSSNQSFGFGLSQNSVASFDTPQPSHPQNGNHQPHPFKNTPINFSPTIKNTTNITPTTNSSHESTPTLNQTSSSHETKKKPRNMFFANVSISNSSSSSSSSINTDSPDSAKFRFSNIAKMQIKKNRHKFLKHPDSPLVQSAMALGKDKFSIRKYYQKKEATALAMGKQSPLVESPSSNSTPAHQHTEATQPQSRQRLVSQASSEDNFTLAPEAFQTDGTPVFDRQNAKMYYDEVKSKRQKMFRRQSTVSSLNSMSLDEIQEYYYDAMDDVNVNPAHSVRSSHDSGYNSISSTTCREATISDNTCTSQTSSTGLKSDNVNFQDLSQFEASSDQEMKAVNRRKEIVPKPSLGSELSRPCDNGVHIDPKPSSDQS